MKVWKKVLLSLLVTSPLAHAAMPLPIGWYIDGSAGKSTFQNKAYPGSVQYTGFGWNGAVGYKFNPFATFEADYFRYADIKVSSSRSPVARDYHYSYALAAKAIIPLGVSGLELFAKAGYGKMKSKTTIINNDLAAQNGWIFDTRSHYSRGVFYSYGANMNLTPNISVIGAFSKLKGTAVTGDGILYSLGLSYLV